MTIINLAMPPWADPIWEPKRYKVMYGGRGSGKSWTAADYLTATGAAKPEKILCAREFQKSIKESAHALISKRIEQNGLSGEYDIGESYIRSRVGTEYLFLGLRHNISQIKSLEGVTKVWVEEAQTISQASWDVLIPTIRTPGSEFIVTMNPEDDDDASYDMFINKKQPDAWVRKVNYDENPRFPAELESERLKLFTEASFAQQQGDNSLMDKYNHIWLGMCRRSTAGAIYGTLMAEAAEKGRICGVPYNPSLPVITSWDIGFSDTNSIWFDQIVGKEIHCIDYYEDSLKSLDHYVKVLKGKPYNYAAHVLPHDAGHMSIRTGMTIAQQLEGMGLGKVGKDLIVLPVDNIAPGIELVRQTIPRTYFDETKCAVGIKALKKYHYEWDEDRQKFKDTPAHDWASHPADARRTFATYISTVKPGAQSQPPQPRIYAQQGWMA
jgi:phage terminase large subunit